VLGDGCGSYSDVGDRALVAPGAGENVVKGVTEQADGSSRCERIALGRGAECHGGTGRQVAGDVSIPSQRDLTRRLTIGEGVETTLAALQLGLKCARIPSLEHARQAAQGTATVTVSFIIFG
jgi:hypothetical protein